MKRMSFTWLVLAVGLLSAAADAAVFTFEWTGYVARIEDGNGDAATMPGSIANGDSFVAATTYNDALFANGSDVTGDGLDYAAPAGQTMRYEFSSGGIFFKEITAVRARDGGAFDQWNWKGGDFGGLLFQANDDTDSSYELPLPVSFADMHALFLATIANFSPSEGNHLEFPATDLLAARSVFFRDQAFSITRQSVPEPATLALFGLGLAGLGAMRRKKLAA